MKNKKLIVILSVIALAAMIASVSVYAYANGSVSIYNGSTKVGVGEIWNNSKSETADGKIVYGSTESYEAVTNLRVNVGYSYINDSGELKNRYGGTRLVTTASTVVTSDCEVTDGVIPLNARGIFTLGTVTESLCKGYNFGSGIGDCSHGDDCPWKD